MVVRRASPSSIFEQVALFDSCNDINCNPTCLSELIPGTRDESESTLVWTLVLATCAVALLVLGGGKCSSIFSLKPAPELPVLYQDLFALLFTSRSYWMHVIIYSAATNSIFRRIRNQPGQLTAVIDSFRERFWARQSPTTNCSSFYTFVTASLASRLGHQIIFEQLDKYFSLCSLVCRATRSGVGFTVEKPRSRHRGICFARRKPQTPRQTSAKPQVRPTHTNCFLVENYHCSCRLMQIKVSS